MNDKQSVERLNIIETKLETVLKPVTPRPSFVDDLQCQLHEEMAKQRKKAKMKKGLLVAGGVVGGVLMVVAIIRSILSWRDMIESVSEWFMKQKKEHQAVSA